MTETELWQVDRKVDVVELRLECLAEANATAKLGLSHDVFQTADRYYRWVIGEEVQPSVPASFKMAVVDLIEAELREERSDIEKIRHDLAEAFGDVEDRHWPKDPAIKPYRTDEDAASYFGLPRTARSDVDKALDQEKAVSRFNAANGGDLVDLPKQVHNVIRE